MSTAISACRGRCRHTRADAHTYTHTLEPRDSRVAHGTDKNEPKRCLEEAHTSVDQRRVTTHTHIHHTHGIHKSRVTGCVRVRSTYTLVSCRPTRSTAHFRKCSALASSGRPQSRVTLVVPVSFDDQVQFPQHVFAHTASLGMYVPSRSSRPRWRGLVHAHATA